MLINLKEKIDDLETKTDSLETVMGQFISSMNLVMVRMERDIQAFKKGVERTTKGSGKKLRKFPGTWKETPGDSYPFHPAIRCHFSGPQKALEAGIFKGDFVPGIPAAERDA